MIARSERGAVGARRERHDPVGQDHHMERVAFTARLLPGASAEYRRRHADVWPELLDEMRAAGCRDYSIYLKDDDIFGVFAVDDFAPDDAAFLPPGDMPARIGDACRRTDQAVPSTRPALVRCILDSLAAAYARAVHDTERLSGRPVEVVHLVGGGARNALLCQLTADACELPVLAGPVEATALGNVLVQARARGLRAGDLDSLRGLVRTTQEIRRFAPRPVTAGGLA
jgi:sugar (pentulose or hexulose) kinase